MTEFTEFEEEQIILLALDSPDFFYRIANFIRPEYFELDQHKYIIATYLEYYEKHDDTPTRDALKNIIYRELKSDDELSEPVISILDKDLDLKNGKYIRDVIIKWARIKQLSMLYSEDVMNAIKDGSSDVVEEIIEKAMSITDVVIKPFKFFDDVDELFIDDKRDYFTSGFTRVDKLIHDGNGPAKREVFIWVAPTGVGKSIMLVNTAIANVLIGKNVLHVTLENSEKITGHRYLGAFTDLPIANRKIEEEKMKTKLRQIKVSETSGDLFVIYFPTDTVSVREIELAISELKRHHGFTPDVIVVDYLECLISKNQHKNKEEYSRQKSVSAELRQLASITDTSLFSASQTNRAGSTSADNNTNINLDKLAESFGKAMPLDYVVSINQSQEQYTNSNESHIGHVRFFFAKNRNGPKFRTINARINYATMKTIQEEIEASQ